MYLKQPYLLVITIVVYITCVLFQQANPLYILLADGANAVLPYKKKPSKKSINHLGV